MKVSNYNNQQNCSFGKFIKINGQRDKIQEFRYKLQNKSDKYLTLCVKKKNDKASLYLISGKHFDKFIDLTKKIVFFDLRTHFEKYMKPKPEKISLKKAINMLKDDKF